MDTNSLIKILNEIEPYKKWFEKTVEKFNKIIILGNGGSNAIASHIAQDYTKILNKKAISFSDASRLTCYINDFGMRNAYSKFLVDFADKDTLVILISSSGESQNILNAAMYCIIQDINFAVLSGFKKNNKLNSFENATFKYWVDSTDYGIIEISHLILLHSIL